jgi:DNA-binding NarL/FixJ family response regulator
MSTPRTIALVADEHEIYRAGLAALLKRDFGYADILEAGSLDEALEQLDRSGKITFAIFDLALPGMSGGSSLQNVRRIFPGLRLAVMTGCARREDILLALTAGVHGFVPKTFSSCEIAQAIGLVLNHQIFVPSSLAELPRSSSMVVSWPAPAAPSKASNLTRRQREVLDLLANGKSNKEIARALDLSAGTVKVHVHALFQALGVHNRASAVAVVARLNPEGPNGRLVSGNSERLR